MYNTAIQYFQYSQSILYYSSSYWVWGGWAENWEETSIKRLQSFLKVPWPGPRPFNRALWFFPKSTQCHPRQKHSTLLSSHSSGPPAPKGRLSLPSWPAHLIPSEPGRCFLHNPLMTWGGGRTLLNHCQVKESGVYSSLHKPTLVLAERTSFWHRVSGGLIVTSTV